MLTRPDWAAWTPDQRRNIRYLWDDTRASEDFRGDVAWILEGAMQMSMRARLALCAAMYESIVWRFEGLHRRDEPLQIAQAAWCATVDPHYLRFFELTRDQWTGPVDGPLWCAMAWLRPALADGHQFEAELFDGLTYLGELALHVMPDAQAWSAWAAAAIQRLMAEHPPIADDPFDDLFARRVGERLGPLVDRDLFDPKVVTSEDSARAFAAKVLLDAQAEQNPFLADPDELEEAGFVGTPYQVPP